MNFNILGTAWANDLQSTLLKYLHALAIFQQFQTWFRLRGDRDKQKIDKLGAIHIWYPIFGGYFWPTYLPISDFSIV